MRIVALPLGGGKTSALIKMSNTEGYYIVCQSLQEASHIQMMADKMKKPIPLPITYDELLEDRYYSKGIKGFLLDDVERFLSYISKNKIVGFSLTTHSDSVKPV